jgi:hypothetical protein
MPTITVPQGKQNVIQRKRLVSFIVRQTISVDLIFWCSLDIHQVQLQFYCSRESVGYTFYLLSYWWEYPLTVSDYCIHWLYLIIVLTDWIYRDKNRWWTSPNDCLFLLQCKEAILCQSRSRCTFILTSLCARAEIVPCSQLLFSYPTVITVW